jgi:tRNA(fMet)-specific endonuclease VapC
LGIVSGLSGCAAVIYLPDTNVLSHYLRGRDRQLRDRLLAALEDCRLSAIVLMELEYGAAKRPDIPALRSRLDDLREMFPAVAPFEEEAAFHTGRARAYLASLRPNAQPIGTCDVMLAGQALALGAVVVTHNVAEFSRVPGLVVEDWESRSGGRVDLGIVAVR